MRRFPLDAEFGDLGGLQSFRVRFEGCLDLGRHQLVNDLWTSADEGGWVEQGLQLWDDGLEVWVVSYPLDEVVGLAFLLDDSAGLV